MRRLGYYRSFLPKRSILKVSAFCLAAVLSISLSGVRAADLVNDEQKTLYAVGVAISQSMSSFALSESELEIVKSGISDGALQRPLMVDMQAYGPKIQQFAQSRAAIAADKEKKAGAAFLAKAAAEPGAKKTASGAIVTQLKAGSGASPKVSDTVKVHYHGTLLDGTVFDSSVQRGQPASFPLTGVIKCWTEGVQEIKVGGKSRLICPADIAYGDRGSPPKIKPGATLFFEVELLEIVK
jgi:FKBP-type peptidyl-prolyl cis-trans isomerase FkpA